MFYKNSLVLKKIEKKISVEFGFLSSFTALSIKIHINRKREKSKKHQIQQQQKMCQISAVKLSKCNETGIRKQKKNKTTRNKHFSLLTDQLLLLLRQQNEHDALHSHYLLMVIWMETKTIDNN
jgi:hypothetical protein